MGSGSLIASLFVSSIGFGFYVYGKKQVRFPQLIVGLLMMVYPYFVPGAIAMTCTGAALMIGLFVALRMGL